MEHLVSGEKAFYVFIERGESNRLNCENKWDIKFIIKTMKVWCNEKV